MAEHGYLTEEEDDSEHDDDDQERRPPTAKVRQLFDIARLLFSDPNSGQLNQLAILDRLRANSSSVVKMREDWQCVHHLSLPTLSVMPFSYSAMHWRIQTPLGQAPFAAACRRFLRR